MGLARVKADQGMHAEAEGLFRQALAILEAGLGPRHDLTQSARAGLAREVGALRSPRRPANPPEGQVMASHHP